LFDNIFVGGHGIGTGEINDSIGVVKELSWFFETRESTDTDGHSVVLGRVHFFDLEFDGSGLDLSYFKFLDSVRISQFKHLFVSRGVQGGDLLVTLATGSSVSNLNSSDLHKFFEFNFDPGGDSFSVGCPHSSGLIFHFFRKSILTIIVFAGMLRRCVTTGEELFIGVG